MHINIVLINYNRAKVDQKTKFSATATAKNTQLNTTNVYSNVTAFITTYYF